MHKSWTNITLSLATIHDVKSNAMQCLDGGELKKRKWYRKFGSLSLRWERKIALWKGNVCAHEMWIKKYRKLFILNLEKNSLMRINI